MDPREFDDFISTSVLSLRARRVIEPLASAVVADICRRNSLTLAAFCDYFARRVGEQFLAGQVEYDVADAAMNALNVYVSNRNETLPEFADAVYLALDAGEYFHRDDSRETDPVQTYTLPMLRQVFEDESSEGGG